MCKLQKYILIKVIFIKNNIYLFEILMKEASNIPTFSYYLPEKSPTFSYFLEKKSYLSYFLDHSYYLAACTGHRGSSGQQAKHLLSPDIILIVEGVSVAVNWCAVLSFSTNLMTSARVWGSFPYILDVIVGASLRPLTKMWIATVSLSKAHHFAAVLKWLM